MRVLVTGAAGFLGAHVVRSLLRAGDEVCALVRPGRPRNHLRRIGVEFLEGDLLDPEVARAGCEATEAVVHCASLISYWRRQHGQLRRVNVEGTMTLLRAAAAAGTTRLVHVSTAAAVGVSDEPAVLDERTPWDPETVTSVYAATKREAEERVLAAAWGGLPALVVNPSLLLGPRLDGLPPSPLILGVQRGRLPWVPPGGVSPTDVSDVADAVARAVHHGRVGERYLLAGHDVSWRRLYETIAENADGRVPRRDLTPRRLAWLRRVERWKDRLRLSSPPLTLEVYRGLGTYAWYDSSKAARELGYAPRPLARVVRHAVRREAP
jgi:dihydroflavonol-4-reductase